MFDNISARMSRNCHEVFGEADLLRRCSTIEELWPEDGVFFAPGGIYRGWKAIDRVAGAVRAIHPEFHHVQTGVPEEVQGTAGRVRWTSGKPGEAPAYAGTTFVIVRDGRIAELHMFFDQLAD